MKFLGVSWSRGRVALLLLLMVAVGAGVLGWQPPPWQGQVRVFRSEYHRARIPHEAGMCVRDAVARSRAVLGERAGEQIAIYRWKAWLPERIPDALVRGLQGALVTAGLHPWSDALWQWWDGFLPRQDTWQQVARAGSVQDWPVESGEMIILRSAR